MPVFFFVNEHNNTNVIKVIQEVSKKKQQLVEENDADNTRKVLCKSFIQWF